MVTHIYFINWDFLASSLLSITARELNNLTHGLRQLVLASSYWTPSHKGFRFFTCPCSLRGAYPESCILISLLPRLLSFTSCLGCLPEFSSLPASLPSLHTQSLSPTFAFSLDTCGSAICFPHLSTKLQY